MGGSGAVLEQVRGCTISGTYWTMTFRLVAVSGTSATKNLFWLFSFFLGLEPFNKPGGCPQACQFLFNTRFDTHKLIFLFDQVPHKTWNSLLFPPHLGITINFSRSGRTWTKRKSRELGWFATWAACDSICRVAVRRPNMRPRARSPVHFSPNRL